MAYVPREQTGHGHDSAWTTANRPANPNHGTMGYNEDTEQIEIYDALNGYWKTTVSVSQVYPA